MGTGRAQREPRKTAGLSRFWRTSALFGLLPAGGTKSRGPSGGFNHRRAEPSRPSTRPSRPRDSRTLRAFTAASTDNPTLRTPNRETGPPRLGAQSREVLFSFFLLPILKPKKSCAPLWALHPQRRVQAPPGLWVIRCVLL